MAAVEERKSEFEEQENRKDDVVHLHFIHRHIPAAVSYPVLILFLLGSIGLVYLYANEEYATKIVLEDGEEEKADFVYGSWLALQNAEFFKKTKEDFVSQGANFLEADLSAMIIRYYKDGKLVKESLIQTKGRDGSWWETPAGLYKISSKEKSHYSSFGRVYMPWSMQFQGNFFIHGPTHYPDGSPTSATYSGGCIRISLDDAEEFYNLVENGTPVLVFEESFNGGKETVQYKNKYLLPDNVVYLAADMENNFVFAKNNAASKHSIASITKLISALVAVEYINVEREVKIDSSMLASTSIPRLEEGERITVLDLLKFLLLESSNEAAEAISAPMGKKQFIELMNTKSAAIGMQDSYFADAAGVLSANVSTAEDLFHLAKYLYYNRSFVLDMSMGSENRIAYGLSRYQDLQNLNHISGTSNMIGGKTGLSSSAGDSMLAIFDTQIGGQKRPIAIVVLGSDDAKRDVVALLKYIRENFALVRH